MYIDSEEEARKKAEAKKQRQQHEWQGKQVFFNGTLAVFTIVLTFVSGYQACLLRESNRASGISAQAAEDAVRVARDSFLENQHARERSDRDRWWSEYLSALEAERSRQFSERQSKAALDATIEMSRNDQRAWITVLARGVLPRANERLRIDLLMRNTGKTVGVITYEHARIHASAAEDIKDYIASAEWKAMSSEKNTSSPTQMTCFPGTQATTPVFSGGPLAQEDINEIQTGRRFVYILGEVIYLDAFKQSHTTGFCFEYGPTGTNFKSCYYHNWAD